MEIISRCPGHRHLVGEVAGRRSEALVTRHRASLVGVHQVLGEFEQAAVRQAVFDHRPFDVGFSGQLWKRRLEVVP